MEGEKSIITTPPSNHPEPRIEPVQDDDAELAELSKTTARLPSWSHIKEKLTTKEGWKGEQDWGYLCLPTLPFALPGKGRKRKVNSTPFYGLNDDMPILLALVCGFQHSLAMLAGVITPPIIFAGELALDASTTNYLVAASLISSGILSMIQMTRFRIPGTKYYFGTGLITVVGTSFATLSTATSIFNALYENGTCPTIVVDGTTTRGPCPDAYGYLIGTTALCSIFEMMLAFVSPKTLRKIFPPTVTGTVILLIGASLIGSSGFLDWAGGSGSCDTHPDTGLYSVCPQEGAQHALPWGSAQYLGLGFLSYVTIILVEYFGSPFMKNASIVIGILVGMIVAGPAGYIDGSTIREAPGITFLWVHTFKLKVYGPAVLPSIAVYISLAMEAMGDITASSEASRQPVDGLIFDSRIQGGVLADGFNGFLAAMFTMAPMSIFAQNNGVISITRCANRTAGYVCATFLILFGILAKISGVIQAIPNPVLGGVTTFLFSSVVVSGLRVLSLNKFTRRDRFILASGLSLGMGNLLVPTWSSYLFTYSGSNQALQGFLDSIIIILSTPFLIAAIIEIILNLTLPPDPDTLVIEQDEEEMEAMNTNDHELEEGRGEEVKGNDNGTEKLDDHIHSE